MNTEKNNDPASVSRRDFIQKSSLALAGFYIVPRHVLGKGYVAPSDKLNLAGVGCGGKGDVDINGVWDNGNENIVALCDVDERQAVKFRAKFPNAKFYKDFREMLDKEKKILMPSPLPPPTTRIT